MYEKVCKKRRRCAPPFFAIREKPVGVNKMTPPPTRSKINPRGAGVSRQPPLAGGGGRISPPLSDFWTIMPTAKRESAIDSYQRGDSNAILTRAPTGGAGIRPPWDFSLIAEKPRRVAPRNVAWIFIYQFFVLCVSGDLLPFKVKSPGHLEWPVVKSLFCIFIVVPEPQLMTNHFETRWMV